MGKGQASDRAPLFPGQVPESEVSLRDLLQADLFYPARKEGGLPERQLVLRRHALPGFLVRPEGDEPVIWRIGHPYEDRRPGASGPAVFGGLILWGADRFAGRSPIESYGKIDLKAPAPPGAQTYRAWEFVFTDGARTGLDVLERRTSCLCSLGDLRVCPHQAFAIFFAAAGLLWPLPSSLARAADGTEAGRFVAWMASVLSGEPDGDLLGDALLGFYSVVRQHGDEQFTIDSVAIEKVLRSL